MKAASRYLLLALLVVSPWALGGVYFQAQVYLYASLLLCGFMWLCSHLCEGTSQGRRYQIPLLIVPVAAGVIFGTIQLIPLSSAEFRQLGPAVSDDLPIDSEVAGLERNSVSIYPLQTRVSIASLSFALLAFFLASQLFSDHKSQLLLFGTIALSGLALSFFGLAQKLSWNGHLFWSGPQVINGKPFASWVNRNNAAGFLNMTFAAALAMLVWSSFRRSSKRAFEYDLLNDGVEGGWREWIHGVLVRLARLRGSQLTFGLCLVVICAGVIGSSSRGGILSLGAGLIAAVIWFVLKKETRLASVIGLLVVVPTVGLISWLGISQSVGSRFEELKTLNFENSARFQNWTETLQALPDIWITGSGLGTYRYLYRPYQQHRAEGFYAHAENQYVETLIEGGAVGLGLLVLAILLGYAAVLRLSRSRAIPREDGVALVGLVALTTQFCHAFLDFGLILPANMLLMAVIMGAVAGRAAYKLAGGRGSWRITFPGIRSRAMPALFAVLLIGNGIFGWIEISRAAIAEKTILQLERNRYAQPTPESYQEDIDRLLTALTYRPDDTELLLALSETYVLSSRVRMHDWLASLANLDPRDPSSQNSLAALYQHVHNLERNNQTAQIDYLKSQPAIKETLDPARSALLAAEASCGWLPQVELSLAYLSVFEEPRDARLHRLERVVYLAPYEPRFLYPVGRLAHASGDDELCLFAWKRTYELSPQLRYDLLLEMQRVYPEVSLGRDFLPRDPSILRYTIEYPTIKNGHPEIIEQCLICVDEMLSTGHDAVSVDELYLDGFRKQWRGQLDEAVDLLEKALQHDAADLSARTLVIELLVKLGDLKKAENHLAYAKQYMSYPESDDLSQLIEQKRTKVAAEKAALDAEAAVLDEKDATTSETETETEPALPD